MLDWDLIVDYEKKQQQQQRERVFFGDTNVQPTTTYTKNDE
jgi:hypothetical protein